VEDAAYPMRLNTVRYRDQWHTMTRTGLSPTLSQHRPEALLEICAEDGLASGLRDGGLARVESPHGAAVFRVRFSTGQRRHVGWAMQRNDGYTLRGVPSNWWAALRWSDRLGWAGVSS